MKLTKLYKKSSTGALLEWEISTEKNVIVTRHGQVGGAIQTDREEVYEGKNIGKVNETNAVEQAEAEATSKWEKKLKKGYVKSEKEALNEEVDAEMIEGGVAPMLAHKFKDHKHKMLYPAHVQPKLDGIRCLAVIKKGNCTLWSRTRKQIKSCPHIVENLIKIFGHLSDIVVDGELYNHELKKDFQKIVSLVRKDKPSPECEKLIQYHMYDIVDEDARFFDRYNDLLYLRNPLSNSNNLHYVETKIANTEQEVIDYMTSCVERGYEGCMVRNAAGGYKIDGRSYDLLKVKEFSDSEYKIVGMNEGKGRMEGKAIFECITPKGATFNVKMRGSLEVLEEIYQNRDAYIGKELTVRYQGFTDSDIPRFPIGIAVRDYE